eukprot:scaffold48353_cov15-Tisochrysis_lutea.AAC.1
MSQLVVLPLLDAQKQQGGSGSVQQAVNVFMDACTSFASVETCQDISSRRIASAGSVRRHVMLGSANVALRAGALCNALNRCSPENDCELDSLASGAEDVEMDFWCAVHSRVYQCCIS